MSDTKRTIPTQEETEVRAYEIYLQRGGENGTALDDWLAAEQELSLTSQTGAAEASTELPMQKRAATS